MDMIVDNTPITFTGFMIQLQAACPACGNMNQFTGTADFVEGTQTIGCVSCDNTFDVTLVLDISLKVGEDDFVILKRHTKKPKVDMLEISKDNGTTH